VKRQPTRIADELAGVEALVGTGGPPAPAMTFPMIVQQTLRDLAFRVAVGGTHQRVDDQAVAIVDDQMSQIREPRLVTVPFAIQLRIGIRLRRMRVVRPRPNSVPSPFASGSRGTARAPQVASDRPA
jgi:hypothetical protein